MIFLNTWWVDLSTDLCRKRWQPREGSEQLEWRPLPSLVTVADISLLYGFSHYLIILCTAQEREHTAPGMNLWENFCSWCWCFCSMMVCARKVSSLVLSGLDILCMIQWKQIFFTAWWSFWGGVCLVKQFIKWWNYVSIQKNSDVATEGGRFQLSGQSEQTGLISSIAWHFSLFTTRMRFAKSWMLKAGISLFFFFFFGGCVLCISLASLEVYWIASHS